MKNIFFVEQNFSSKLSGLLISDGKTKSFTTKWKVGFIERIKILFFGNLWVTLKNNQDLTITTDKPFEKV